MDKSDNSAKFKRWHKAFEKLIDKFTILPVAPTFAEAIEKIYEDQPFNSVFG